MRDYPHFCPSFTYGVRGAKVWASRRRVRRMPAIKWVTGTEILVRTPIKRVEVAL